MRTFALTFFITLAAAAACRGADDKVSFKRDIAPILLQQCQTCHGPDKSKGKFRVDSFDQLCKPGSSGDPSITPGDPKKSQVFNLLVAADPEDRMPQKADPLPAAQIETLRKWIEQGAAFDGADKAAAIASYVQTADVHAPEVYKRAIPITALAFSDDGAHLLAGGYHELTEWDAETGKLVDRLPLPIERVQSIGVDAASGRIAVAGGKPGVGGELLLLPPGGKGAIRSLEKTADFMLVARFSPDGKQVAAGGSDGMVRLFDVESGKRIWRIEPHADWVTDLSFSPDGKLLVTASRDKSCRVFEVKSALAESSFLDDPEPIYAVAFAADGKTIFSGGHERKLHAWTVSEGKSLTTTGGFTGDILRLARAGGSIFSAGADGALRQHSIDEGVAPKPVSTQPEEKKKEAAKPQPRKLLRKIEASQEWLYALAVEEKTGRVATGAQDGKVRIWTIADGKPIAAFVASPGVK